VLVCKFPDCRGVIGSDFAVRCGPCGCWFHGSCVQLTAATADDVDSSYMEWVCADCAIPAVLGKYYIRHEQLALAVEYCMFHDDSSIYLDICHLGKTFHDYQSLFKCRTQKLPQNCFYFHWGYCCCCCCSLLLLRLGSKK
jgi:hypothetical protein